MASNYHLQSRIRPRGLVVPCRSCGRNVSYDPSQSVHLCATCEEEVLGERAMNEDSYHYMEQGLERTTFQDRAMNRYDHERTLQAREDGLFRGTTMNGHRQYNNQMHRTFGNPGTASNTSSTARMTPAMVSAEATTMTRAYTDRYFPASQAVPTQSTIASYIAYPKGSQSLSDGEDIEFVDAKEEQRSESDSEGDIAMGEAETGAHSSSSATEGAKVARHQSGETVEGFEAVADVAVNQKKQDYESPDAARDDDDDDDDDDDLFAQTWGRGSREAIIIDSDEEKEGQAVQDLPLKQTKRIDGQRNKAARIDRKASKLRINTPAKHFPPSEIQKLDAKGLVNGFSNPITTAFPTTAAVTAAVPVRYRDLDRRFRDSFRWHQRAVHFIPRLPLAPHRYWIGVLHLEVDSTRFTSEKNFVWMRGNRLTTVETVRNTYATMTGTGLEAFELMLGCERLKDGEKMEELNYFLDKKIVFRAVEIGRVGKLERGTCEDIIRSCDLVSEPEVVVLDD